MDLVFVFSGCVHEWEQELAPYMGKRSTCHILSQVTQHFSHLSVYISDIKSQIDCIYSYIVPNRHSEGIHEKTVGGTSERDSTKNMCRA